MTQYLTTPDALEATVSEKEIVTLCDYCEQKVDSTLLYCADCNTFSMGEHTVFQEDPMTSGVEVLEKVLGTSLLIGPWVGVECGQFILFSFDSQGEPDVMCRHEDWEEFLTLVKEYS